MPEMQLGLPFGAPARDAGGVRISRHTVVVGRRSLTVTYVRNVRARHYIIRVEDDGSVRVTIPRGGSRARAGQFVQEKAKWIDKEVYRAALRKTGPALPSEEGRELRKLAARALPARLLELAAGLGRQVAGVTVRAQRTRWGSCSPAGRISLNWRLVQLPDSVRDYVLLHELTHLLHMDHSKRFWRELARVCPWHREARAWLRAHGRLA
jgi:predicted metal-dependent hydrolase